MENERCQQCILPITGSFQADENGVCRLCNIAKNESTRQSGTDPERELAQHIQEVKEKHRNRPYDCVVGLSGGRDSSYLLYLLTRKLGLRCVAGYYRTPFTSDTTDANVRRLTEKLGVRLEELDISQEYHRQIAREMVLIWFRKPSPVVTNMACAPCKLVNVELYKLAQKYNVETIILGVNPYEMVQIASSVPAATTMTTQTAAGQLSANIQMARAMLLFRKGLGALWANRELWKYAWLGIQSSLFYVTVHTPFLRFRYRNIYPLEYFYFSEWNEDTVIQALQGLGWKLPPGCKSTWKSDCGFAEIKNWMFKSMTGTTYLDAFLSNMVRAGAMTRAEALRKVKKEGVTSAKRMGDMVEVLALPQDISRQLMDGAE